jgi:hypothetical protein
MGQGQDPQGHLLGFPFSEFSRGMTGLGDGCGDLGWVKLDNSAVTLFDLFNHRALLGCNIRFWWFETTKKCLGRHFFYGMQHIGQIQIWCNSSPMDVEAMIGRI